jgi:hypothetical protein
VKGLWIVDFGLRIEKQMIFFNPPSAIRHPHSTGYG